MHDIDRFQVNNPDIVNKYLKQLTARPVIHI